MQRMQPNGRTALRRPLAPSMDLLQVPEDANAPLRLRGARCVDRSAPPCTHFDRIFDLLGETQMSVMVSAKRR